MNKPKRYFENETAKITKHSDIKSEKSSYYSVNYSDNYSDLIEDDLIKLIHKADCRKKEEKENLLKEINKAYDSYGEEIEVIDISNNSNLLLDAKDKNSKIKTKKRVVLKRTKIYNYKSNKKNVSNDFCLWCLSRNHLYKSCSNTIIHINHKGCKKKLSMGKLKLINSKINDLTSFIPLNQIMSLINFQFKDNNAFHGEEDKDYNIMPVCPLCCELTCLCFNI